MFAEQDGYTGGHAGVEAFGVFALVYETAQGWGGGVFDVDLDVHSSSNAEVRIQKSEVKTQA